MNGRALLRQSAMPLRNLVLVEGRAGQTGEGGRALDKSTDLFWETAEISTQIVRRTVLRRE